MIILHALFAKEFVRLPSLHTKFVSKNCSFVQSFEVICSSTIHWELPNIFLKMISLQELNKSEIKCIINFMPVLSHLSVMIWIPPTASKGVSVSSAVNLLIGWIIMFLNRKWRTILDKFREMIFYASVEVAVRVKINLFKDHRKGRWNSTWNESYSLQNWRN